MKAAEITDALIDAAAEPESTATARELRQRRHGRPHRQSRRGGAWRSKPSTSAIGASDARDREARAAR